MNYNLINITEGKSLNSRASGSIVFDFLLSKHERGERFNLSFYNVEGCSTAFLNASIGKFIMVYGVITFNSLVNITDVKSEFLKNLINSTIENASDYLYNDKLIAESIA